MSKVKRVKNHATVKNTERFVCIFVQMLWNVLLVLLVLSWMTSTGKWLETVAPKDPTGFIPFIIAHVGDGYMSLAIILFLFLTIIAGMSKKIKVMN